MFGLGTPVIYINNRKARADELQQLTPQDIRSVELITNPDARYDAEGKAVLKVYTLRRDDGHALLAEHVSEQGRRYSDYETLRYDYWNRKLHVSAYYQYADYRSVVNQPQSHELALGDSCICTGIPTRATAATRSNIRGTLMQIMSLPPVT